tara:strand:- start:510 stop:1103 length:594 start_codon:yes stop_codon:yes gene_type:complete
MSKDLSVTDWIVKDIDQYKISDLYFPNENILKQFVEDHIFTHPNCMSLLPQLSNIIPLIAEAGSDEYCRDRETCWSQVLNDEHYAKLSSQRKLILGWMLLSDDQENEHIKYIEHFDTVVRGLNIGKIMIDKYESRNGITLIPKEIIDSSVNYWAKILGFIEDGNIKSELVNQYITKHNLDRNKLSWTELYSQYKTDE